MNKKVAIITGFHKSTDFLLTLFNYLNNQTYKSFDLYIYNSSGKEINKFENLNFDHHIVPLKENMGFAGGNNAAIAYAKQKHAYDYYVLVNDDTKPHKDWLQELVNASIKNPSAGAISSKMVFYEKFVSLIGTTQTIQDQRQRELGVMIYKNTGFADTYYARRFYQKGFHEIEENGVNEFRWTTNTFEIYIPVAIPDNKEMVHLNLFIHKHPQVANQTLSLKIGSYKLEDIRLNYDQTYYPVMIPVNVLQENARYIIQNAGSTFDRNYNGSDIGSGEFDTGQYNQERTIDSFCGGSCLLTKEALQKTGLFNGYFFCYYEDSDLSLRMKKKGYDIVYAPSSLILHHHSGSSKEWSPFFIYHVFRNKIIFATKNFGFNASLKTFRERYHETVLYYKWSSNQKFKNKDLNARFKLNLVILKDALKGIIKYKPRTF